MTLNPFFTARSPCPWFSSSVDRTPRIVEVRRDADLFQSPVDKACIDPLGDAILGNGARSGVVW